MTSKIRRHRKQLHPFKVLAVTPRSNAAARRIISGVPPHSLISPEEFAALMVVASGCDPDFSDRP